MVSNAARCLGGEEMFEGRLPSAPAACKGAVQTLPAPLVPHLLLPDGDVGAIVTDVRVQGRQRCSIGDVGGLGLLEICLVLRARPLVGHVESLVGAHRGGIWGRGAVFDRASTPSGKEEVGVCAVRK